jgi:flagellar hook-associated protein 2
MAGMSLGGLASGMDTEGIIASLLAIERQPRNRLVLDQTAATTRQQALRDVSSRLKTLRFATEDLGSVALWAPKQTISSSDEAKISARMNGGAAPGGYNLAVTQMATSAQSTYTWTPQAGASTLDINGVTVSIDPGANIDNAVATINSNASLGVFAVNVGGDKLILTSRTTGQATSLSAAGAALAFQSSTAGQDAKFTINGGTEQSSATNVVKDVIPGAEFTIKAITAGTTVSVSTPDVDKTAVKDKLKAFVSAYNDAVDFITSKTTEKKVSKSDGSQLSSSEAIKGVLFGDPGLRTVMSSMRIAIGETVAGLSAPYDSLAALGVSTGATTGGGATNADSLKGRLTLDETKLDAALDNDPLAVQKLLGGVTGTRGFSQVFKDLVEPMVTTNGTFDQRIDIADRELKRIQDAIGRVDSRLSVREEMLRKQFSAMELAMQRSQAQATDLAARLGQSSS